MQRLNVICLVIDRLHAGYLGAYGNTWIHTPALDQFAADSFVFDRFTIDSPRLESLYRSFWLGLHAMCPHRRTAGRRSLAAAAAESGVRAALITDDAIVAKHP